MRHIAAYLLAVLGGNNNPNAEDLKKIFAAAGVEADEAQTNKIIEELKGKNVYELMKAGVGKLASFGGGGGGAARATGGAPAGGSVPAGDTKAEVKKEEKKEEKEEKEEEEQSIGGLFGSEEEN